MPTEVAIHDPFPEYDGSIRLKLVDAAGGELKSIDVPDVEKFNNDMLKTLGEDERSGMPFLRAIARFMRAAYGVDMSVTAAATFYKEVARLVSGANTFFTKRPDSVGTTESGQTTSESTSASLSSGERSSELPTS